MIALDASVIIAHLDLHNVHHQVATRILLEADPDTLLVHTITLAEVLVGGVKNGHGESMREDLRAAGIRVAARDEDESLRLANLRATTNLKMPDCCVLDVATRNNASLATFDKNLASAARRQHVPVLPDDR